MTLLFSILAAVITTVLWYGSPQRRAMKLGTLSLMYWGASLMWMADAVAAYLEMGAEYFQPQIKEMVNDAFLGASVVTLGLVIWLVMVLVQDPKGVLHKTRTDA